MSSNMQTTLPDNQPTVVFTRTFDAPRALVFEAWTNPEHLARWWGPFDTATTIDMDARQGGYFNFTMNAPDGEQFPHGGKYSEFVRPERLVFSNVAGDRDWGEDGGPPNCVVTVVFDERDGKTTLTITSLLASFEERDALVKVGAPGGWAMSFDKLDTLLEKVQA